MVNEPNRIRRVTVNVGGCHYGSFVVDGAQRASGSVTENQRVTSYTKPGTTAAASSEVEPAFSPEDINNLAAWWDPTISANIDNPTGMTAYRDVITGASFDQSNPGARPNVQAVNGVDAVQCDGGDHMADLVATTVLQPGSGDFTVVAVFQSTDANRGLIIGKDDGAGRRWFIRTHSNGTDFEFSIDDDTTAQTVTATDVDFSDGGLYVVIGSRDGTNLTFHYGDGGALAESSASPVAIGAYGSLGAGQATMFDNGLGGGQAFTGEVGDMMFYKQALSAQERSDLYDFLVSKWGM